MWVGWRFCVLVVILGHNRKKHKGQYSKDGRLYQTNEDLHEEEGDRQDKGEDRHHGPEQYLTREHIAEKSERERSRLGKLADKLDEPNEEFDRIDHDGLIIAFLDFFGYLNDGFVGQKLVRVRAQADELYTGKVGDEDRDKRERKCGIEVGGRPAEKGNKVPTLGKADRADAGQEAKPVVDEYKEEERENEGQEEHGLLLGASDRFGELYRPFDHHFKKVLQASRCAALLDPQTADNEPDHHNRKEGGQKGIGDGHGAQAKYFFSVDGYFVFHNIVSDLAIIVRKGERFVIVAQCPCVCKKPIFWVSGPDSRAGLEAFIKV